MAAQLAALERDVAAGPLAAVLDSLCEEPGVDAVVVDVAPTPRLRRRELDRVVGLVHESHPGVALLLVDGGLLDAHGHPLRSDVPSFADDARALRALSVAGRAGRVEDCEGLLPAPGPRGGRRRR